MNSLQIAGVSGEAKFAQDEGEIVVEPRFKYERVLGDVARTLEKDSASCVAVHDKFLAIGFSSGRIGFFDHFGNGHFECKTKNHRCSVSHIAVDGAGNYVISCANDKQVCIQGFGHSDYNQVTSDLLNLLYIQPFRTLMFTRLPNAWHCLRIFQSTDRVSVSLRQISV
jgi:hypothetical protein